MSFLTDLWASVVGALQSALELLHDGFEPVFGAESWGWAIIALTLVIRVVLLPIAIKQSRSMRAMQELQPRIKEIQDKYRVDRSLAKKDPELYQKKKAEQNKQMMALYQEEGVNPAASCLPLVAQAPIFFALFSVLRNPDFEALRDAPFYIFTSAVQDPAATGLGAITSLAGWPGWLLIGGMVVTMFITQKQTMARGAVEGPAAQQQKVLLYIMPAFLAFISRGLPLGVLLYWVTTNLWQGVQQYIIFRDRAGDEAAGGAARRTGPARGDKGAPDRSPGAKPSDDAKPGLLDRLTGGATARADGSSPGWPSRGSSNGSPRADTGQSTPRTSSPSADGTAARKDRGSDGHLPGRRT